MTPLHQHYVPQFYLRYFAFSPKKRSQVYVHDVRKDNSIFISSIGNIAQERSFYNTSSGRSAEQALAEIEGKVSRVWKKLAKGNLNVLSQEDREYIALFVCTMMVRTIATKESMIDASAAIRNRLKIENRELSPTLEAQLDISHDALTNSLINLIGQSSQWIPLILDMLWVIGTPPAGRLFPTSDNPLVRHNTDNPDSLGLMSPGIE